MDGLLLGLAERDLHNKLDVMIKEMQTLRHAMSGGQAAPTHGFATVQYDWDNPEFQGACDAIQNDFFKRHPEFVRGSGEFSKAYPEKVKGIEVLNRMSELNRIHPDEYLLLFKQIYAF